VTADHVYQGYLDAIASNSDLRCVLYDTEFNISGRFIDRSTKLDVATFEVRDDEIQQIGNRIAHEPPKSMGGVRF